MKKNTLKLIALTLALILALPAGTAFAGTATSTLNVSATVTATCTINANALNFGAYNPNRAFMDHLLQWNLIHRGEMELRDIFASTPFGGDIDVVVEPRGVNLVAIAVKRP